MALRLLSNRALRAFMLPRRGLDEFVTGSAAPPAKAKDAAKKDEKDVDAAAAGRPWNAAELRRMYDSLCTFLMATCLPALLRLNLNISAFASLNPL
jgi:hypothetical protein